MSVKLLTEHRMECLSIKGGFTGSFESTLVKLPHCWKSRVVAHSKIFKLSFLCQYLGIAKQNCVFGLVQTTKAHSSKRISASSSGSCFPSFKQDKNIDRDYL